MVTCTRWRWLFPAIAFVYLYAFPYFDALRSANELPRLLLTREIVEHRTFRLDAAAGELGSTFDVATTPDGHRYSNKAPGPSFLAVPVYAALRAAVGSPTLRQMTWAFRVTCATLPMLLFLWSFRRELPRFAEDAGARRAAFLAFALGSMALPYGLLFYSHAPAMACAWVAFLAALAGRGGPSWAGCWRAGGGVRLPVRPRGGGGRRLRGLAPPGVWSASPLGGAAPAALLLFYHWAAFGSPLRTGYAFAVDPAHKQGFLGVVGPNWKALAQALVAPDNGLLFLTRGCCSPRWAWWPGGGAPRRWCARRWRSSTCCSSGRSCPSSGAPAGAWGRATSPWRCRSWPGSRRGARRRRAATRSRAPPRTRWSSSRCSSTSWRPRRTRTGRSRSTTRCCSLSLRALGEGLAPHSLGTWLGLSGIASLVPVYVPAVAIAGALLGIRRTTLVAAVLAAGMLVGYSRIPETASADKWEFVRRQWEP